MRKQFATILLLGLFLPFAGCGGGGHKSTPPPTVSISVSPASPSVVLGATQQFSSTVTGSTSTAVTWSTSGPGTISSSGLYTAPATATTPVSVTVKATAQADASKSASAQISIPVVSAAIAPGSANTIVGATQQFTATVQNATDTSVTWSASAGGTISASGLYTAPRAMPTPATVTITATPKADASKAVTATVNVPAVSIALTPGKATVTNGAAQKFAATVSNATDASVTWTMTGKGTIDKTGQYTAPASFASGDAATVTATSNADNTKSISATVSLEVFSRTVAGYVIMPDADFKSLTVDFIDTASGKVRPAGVHVLSTAMYTNPALVAVHPSKPFIYTDAGLTGVLGYILSANGDMTLIPGSPFPAPALRPDAFYITPNGKFLYVTNWYGYMWGWSIDESTGVLTALSGSPWSNGMDGHGMVADAASKHLYAMTVGDYQDSTIGVFDIDPDTGLLTQVQSITAPGTGGSSGMDIDPSGKFLYAIGFYNGTVDGFKIDATTGQLTFIPGSPFAGGYPG